MSSEVPTIQVLEKEDYRKQHLVKLPDALPPSPLDESQVRVRSSIISLTVNNITYARLGDVLGWWNVWPTPASLPEPYNDTTKYGRVSAWGYCTVIDSTVPTLSPGTELFGYLPIGTLPEVLTIEESADVPGHFLEKSSGRQHLMNIYNRYLKVPSAGLTTNDAQAKALHSLLLGLFETSFNLNRHALSWDSSRPPISPGPDVPGNPNWTRENADIKDALVLILAASGKTALSFAHNLKHNRSTLHKPSKVVAIGSESSLEFLKSTNLYDNTFPYSSINNSDLVNKLGINSSTKISIFNFGARGDSATDLADILKSLTTKPFTLVAIASDPTPTDPADMESRLVKHAEQGWVQANASGMRDSAMEMLGEKAYFEELGVAADEFRVNGGAGLQVEWGEGMEAVGEGWERLVAGMVETKKGLVFKL